MGTAAVTALLSAALAGVDGTAVDLQVSGRAETSASAFAHAGGAPRQLVATDFLPRLSLSLDRRTTRLALGYEPQLRLSGDVPYAGARAGLAHGGFARAGWDLSPLWRATTGGRTSVRLVDLAAPSGADLGRLLELRAPGATLRLLDSAASAAVEGRPTRRVTIGSTVGVAASRGLGAEGRAAMPALRELRAAGSVARDQTIRDVLRLELAWTDATFEEGRTASLATLTAGWAHAATRAVRLRLSGSASRARDGEGSRIVPGGAVELDATPAFLGRPLRASAAVRAVAAVDRFGEGVQERFGADGAIAWEPAPRWTLGAGAAAGRVQEARGYFASRGELRAAWRSSRRVTLFAATWSEWHRDPALVPASTTSSWGTSLGVELLPATR